MIFSKSWSLQPVKPPSTNVSGAVTDAPRVPEGERKERNVLFSGFFFLHMEPLWLTSPRSFKNITAEKEREDLKVDPWVVGDGGLGSSAVVLQEPYVLVETL